MTNEDPIHPKGLERYDGLNGVAVRDALTNETDLAVLRFWANDPRVLVNGKAKSRIKRLETAPEPESARPVHRPAEVVRTERRRNLVSGDGPDALKALFDGRGPVDDPAFLANLATPSDHPDDIEAAETQAKNLALRSMADHIDISDRLRSALPPVDSTHVAETPTQKPRFGRVAPKIDETPVPPKAECGLQDEDTLIDDTTPPIRTRGERGAKWVIPAVEESRTCKCGAHGLISEVFGYRHIPIAGGKKKQVSQPQCKKCRSEAARKAIEKKRALNPKPKRKKGGKRG